MNQLLDDRMRQAVAVQAREWLGTPYHHHARLIDVGVDCAQLPAAVYESLGLIPHIEPEYAPQWHLHRSEEVYVQWLLKLGAQRVPEPRVGDFGLWQFGRTYSHGGIVVQVDAVPGGAADGASSIRIVHAYVGLGVVETAVHEAPLHGRDVQWWSL